jgi:sodium-independent sulfate anion transporter 11
MRPKLKAIILDFSAVDNVDVTSVQCLIDSRNVLDRHAAPHSVQWHFASVFNPWAKRALAAAGFGYPSFETEDGQPQYFKPIYSLAEMVNADPERQREQQVEGTGPERRKSRPANDVEQGESGGFTTQEEKVVVEKLEVSKDGKITKDEKSRMTAVHGINRPFFHPDIQSALTSAVATLMVIEATMEITPEEKEKLQSEKEEKED